jgi:hemolysin III
MTKEIISEMKNPPTPRTKLRGWFHFCFTPIALAATIVLIVIAASSGSGAKTLGCVVYLVASLLLFGNSGVYHLFNWGDKVKLILRKIDHLNIFLLIAGTYTPLCLTLLPFGFDSEWGWFWSGEALLLQIWSLAIIALIIHLLWMSAPRVLYVIIYIFLGVYCLMYIPAFLHFGGPIALFCVIMLGSGGACYIIGAIFYALKWPGKNAKVFGFHELFHIFTLLAWACHCISIYFAVIFTIYN